MHQIAPHLILENFVHDTFSGEFTAAGIFVDISGYSTMTDVLMQHGQHGAEVLAWMMKKIFDPLINHIHAQGGFIVGFAGDGITALFPYQDDSKTNLRRALAASWAIQQQMANMAPVETVYGVFPISAKVGLACGNVTWGILRSQGGLRAIYYFSGEAVNASAAAEHHARAGEIILTRAVFEQMGREISVSERDEFLLLTEIRVGLPVPQPVRLTQPDVETLRVFFPDALLKENVPSEFRQVVNLFIQLPDLSEEALTAFVGQLFEMQARYGGLISRIDFGDKGCNLLLFWGAPIAYENDIVRALNFVFNLRQQCGILFRAGVSYYVASAGFMGSDQREEFTCYGRGVNLAARMMSSAAFGEIWLDENIANRAARHFQLAYLGEQTLKGLARKQKIFLLHGITEIEDRLYLGEMVGRQDELAQLEKFASLLWDHRFAGSLLVWGEAGIGKSRLLHEFQTSGFFRERSILWAHCQADQILRQPFNPFRSWLMRYFGVSESREAAQNLAEFQSRLQILVDETSDLFNLSCYQRKLMEQARTKRPTLSSKPLAVTA